MNIDPRIAAYVAELSQPSVPVISYSHETLRRLYAGEVIDALLKDHWRAVARQTDHDARVKVDALLSHHPDEGSTT